MEESTVNKYVDAVEGALELIIKDEKARKLHQALVQHVQQLLKENEELRSRPKGLDPEDARELFKVVTSRLPTRKISAIREIRSATGLELKEAKELATEVLTAMERHISPDALRRLITQVRRGSGGDAYDAVAEATGRPNHKTVKEMVQLIRDSTDEAVTEAYHEAMHRDME